MTKRNSHVDILTKYNRGGKRLLLVLAFWLGLASGGFASVASAVGPIPAAGVSIMKAPGTPPIKTAPQYWDGYWDYQWVEVCEEYWQPGYTDRDWDIVLVCEWVQEWFWVDVWVDDEPDCGLASPTPTLLSKLIAQKSASLTSYQNAPKVLRRALPANVDPSRIRFNNDQQPYRQLDYISRTERTFAAARVFVPRLAAAGIAGRQNFGVGWVGKWDKSLTINEGADQIRANRNDGGYDDFVSSQDGGWKNARPNSGTLTRLVNARSGEILWQLEANGTIERYSASGRLATVEHKSGGAYSLSYENDGIGPLSSVTNARGERIVFEYDQELRVSRVIAPNVIDTKFSYNASGYVIESSVTGGDIWKYSYEKGSASVAPLLRSNSNIELSASRQDSLGTGRVAMVADNVLKVEKSGAESGIHLSTPMTSNSCPAPCESWMRLEISRCLDDADQESTRREGVCLTDWLTMSAIASASENPAAQVAANREFTACLDAVRVLRNIQYALCKGRYPQCS